MMVSMIEEKANSTLWTLGYQSLFHMNQLSSQEAQTKSYNEMSHMFFSHVEFM